MDTTKSNKLVADFMALKQSARTEGYLIPRGKIQLVTMKTKNLMYNSSWDWLMPAVEKIEQIEYVDEFAITYCSVSGVWIDIRLKGQVGSFARVNVDKSKIEGVYKTVVEFIKWYNSNSTSGKQQN